MKTKSSAFFNSIFWIAFACYAVAYFLPSYAESSSENLLGYFCAYFSVVLLFSTPSPLIIIGNFANLTVLVLLFMRLPIFSPKRGFTVFAVVLIGTAVSGTLAWTLIAKPTMLGIGYFVWTLATIAMAFSFLLYRRALRQETLQKESSNACPADHLLFDND